MMRASSNDLDPNFSEHSFHVHFEFGSQSKFNGEAAEIESKSS